MTDVDQWVEGMKSMEALDCIGIVEGHIGVWAITWCVSRVDKPERHGVKAKPLDPTKRPTSNDWTLLRRVLRAFGSPDCDDLGEDAPSFSEIDWSWPADE